MHGGVLPSWQHGSSDTYSVASAELGQAARLDRVDLRVRAAVALVVALAEHLAVARDHRADERVRA